MTFKLILARIAYLFERGFDQVRQGPSGEDPIIDCYAGYTTPKGIVLRGRVLAKARPLSARQKQSKWRNFRDFLSLFNTDELAGLEIIAPSSSTSTFTDEEGFYYLLINDTPATYPRTLAIRAAGADQVHHAPVFASASASFGVISDIDDTLMHTGAFSLLRNLWTSATGNVHEREIFEDAAELLQTYRTSGACFFYVSSSPWNLHEYLHSIFARADVPLGPFFLRDLGISPGQFITGTHGDHKTQAIETILAAEPQLDFMLVGDTGQHDPQIYADIATRHTGRISQVILRRPTGRQLSPKVEADIARMQATGVDVIIDTDYRALLSGASRRP